MRRLAVGVLLALILPLSACTMYDDDYGDGGYYDRPYPPPGHGDWRWDNDLGAYGNVGYPYVYYHDHAYYRWHDNHWSSGPGYGGPWRVIEHRYVPARLGQRYYPRQLHDNRRVDDRYDYRQPRYIERNQPDYRRQPNWQNQRMIDQRRDTDHDRNDLRQDRSDQRDERFGRGDDNQLRRQMQQLKGHELDRQPQRPDGRQQELQRQWQQQRLERRQVQGMPLNRQQQSPGNERRTVQQRLEQRMHEQRQHEQEQRAVGQPSRQEQGGRRQSGQNQNQGQGQGQNQGQEQGRGAGGLQWNNRR